jgi:hypothetical protein
LPDVFRRSPPRDPVRIARRLGSLAAQPRQTRPLSVSCCEGFLLVFYPLGLPKSLRSFGLRQAARTWELGLLDRIRIASTHRASLVGFPSSPHLRRLSAFGLRQQIHSDGLPFPPHYLLSVMSLTRYINRLDSNPECGKFNVSLRSSSRTLQRSKLDSRELFTKLSLAFLPSRPPQAPASHRIVVSFAGV